MEYVKDLELKIKWLEKVLPLRSGSGRIDAIEKVLTVNRDIVELLDKRGISVETIRELCSLAQQTLDNQSKHNRCTIDLVIDFKDPDGLGAVGHFVGEELRKQYFEYGEYASLQLVIDKQLNIVEAQFIPIGG